MLVLAIAIVLWVAFNVRCFSSSIPVPNARRRRKIQSLYIQVQIANDVVNFATRQCLPYAFFALGTTIVIGLFTFIRHFGHSVALINLVVALVGIVCLGFLFHTFWASWDGLEAIRMSEDLVRKLRSPEETYLKALPKMERLWLLKRARAIKPLHIQIGNFSTYDQDALFAIWNEIINQLVFLLSI